LLGGDPYCRVHDELRRGAADDFECYRALEDVSGGLGDQVHHSAPPCGFIAQGYAGPGVPPAAAALMKTAM
jgi:hypothetical protein